MMSSTRFVISLVLLAVFSTPLAADSAEVGSRVPTNNRDWEPSNNAESVAERHGEVATNALDENSVDGSARRNSPRAENRWMALRAGTRSVLCAPELGGWLCAETLLLDALEFLRRAARARESGDGRDTSSPGALRYLAKVRAHQAYEELIRAR